jgi:hypothetical protein
VVDVTGCARVCVGTGRCLAGGPAGGGSTLRVWTLPLAIPRCSESRDPAGWRPTHPSPCSALPSGPAGAASSCRFSRCSAACSQSSAGTPAAAILTPPPRGAGPAPLGEHGQQIGMGRYWHDATIGLGGRGGHPQHAARRSRTVGLYSRALLLRPPICMPPPRHYSPCASQIDTLQPWAAPNGRSVPLNATEAVAAHRPSWCS